MGLVHSETNHLLCHKLELLVMTEFRFSYHSKPSQGEE